MDKAPEKTKASKARWLNGTVLGIGLASLFSDWAHETATTLLPTFLASLGVAAVWLGLIEGVADGLSSTAKLASGFATDRLARRKPVAVFGYLVTALGTAAFGLATSAWHVLIARSTAWLGRGVRTPIRKALLAGAVTKKTYGRAFGLERMMDTLGAILGPATAFLLLPLLNHNYRRLFALTLIPGIAAAFAMMFLVKEQERKRVAHVSFGQSLRSLPGNFKKLLVAVGLFGAGDFAHSLLILLATQKLTSSLGVAGAAAAATGLYVLHNVCYAGSAPVTGWLADRFNKGRLLAAGYLTAGGMALAVMMLPLNLWTLALVFAMGGTYMGMVETLEDSFSAELVDEEQHGMAFGTLATVNGIGDFVSSVMVGVLWSAFGTWAAFTYCAFLFFGGAGLVLRTAGSGSKTGQ